VTQREPVLQAAEVLRLTEVLANRKPTLSDMAFLAEVQQRFEAREQGRDA